MVVPVGTWTVVTFSPFVKVTGFVTSSNLASAVIAAVTTVSAVICVSPLNQPVNAKPSSGVGSAGICAPMVSPSVTSAVATVSPSLVKVTV